MLLPARMSYQRDQVNNVQYDKEQYLLIGVNGREPCDHSSYLLLFIMKLDEICRHLRIVGQILSRVLLRLENH